MTGLSQGAFPTPVRLAFASLILSPFAFGAVNADTWAPLAWLWILLGAWSLIKRPLSRGHESPLRGVNHFFLAIHVLIAIQLLPLPPAVLQAISPGSFAAHFIPPRGDAPWAPLTASATGTGQAWLFFGGIHGLVLTLFRAPALERSTRTAWLFGGMAFAGGLLALEGLVQAASPHPYWLYGVFRVPGAGSHESGIFGPYYNRDHYSNLIAIAASVAAGLLANRLPRERSRLPTPFVSSPGFPAALALFAALTLMVAASAASGSRGGLAAVSAGVLVGVAPALRHRPRLMLASAFAVLLVLFGTGIPAAFARLADVDFEASRLMVWRDVVRLIEFFPIFGCGIGAFAPAYWPYQRVVRFEYWPHVHNEYLQWSLETGVVGLILASVPARAVWLAAPRIARDPQLRPALAGVTASLAHALVDCGFRVPANASWAAVLVVCLFLSSGRGSRGKRV